MQSLVSYLSSGNKTGSISVNGASNISNTNQSFDAEIEKTPTNPKKRKQHNIFLQPENKSFSLEPLKLDKSRNTDTSDTIFKLNKNLQVLIKVKPLFAEEEEEEARKQKLLQKTNTSNTIMKQQLNEMFKDLDPILEIPNSSVVCYKGVSVTQQQNNSRDYIMSNPIASPNNTRYNRDRIMEFDQVYNEDDEDIEKLYNKWITPHLENNGIENLNIFTYGSTGCGKTFTIQNILDFLMNDIFKFDDLNIQCSYMEIYNDKVRDLLTGETADNLTDLFIRENFQGSQCIDGLSVHSVKTIDELKEIVQYGHDQRFTEETNLNKRSSRSHSILTMNVMSNTLNKKFTIVDLAGSERATKAQNKGIRLKEGAMINKSLLALANCINSLTSEDSNKHVPFRDSKLTRLLKHVLTADEATRTVMIACVSGILRNKDETLNTLMYAKRCMGINNEFQHLNFSSNSGANESITAPTISTLTRVRSISVRKNESRVASRNNRVVSGISNSNKIGKNRSTSVNVFNTRNISQQRIHSSSRKFSIDDRNKQTHEPCQMEIQSWKDKFLKITNELNSFTNTSNISSENSNSGFGFLKKEIIDPKVMIFLERRSWQLVKHSLANLLTIFSNDSDITMRSIILNAISSCNEKLYNVQKLIGNSNSLLRELEALTLSKGIVLGQLDILSKIIESEIHNDFITTEEICLMRYYNSVFNFVDNLKYILNSEENLKIYLNFKFEEVSNLVQFIRSRKIDEFIPKEFVYDQLDEQMDDHISEPARNNVDISVIRNSHIEKNESYNNNNTDNLNNNNDDDDNSFPSTSSAVNVIPDIAKERVLQMVDLSTLSNEEDEENMVQQINIDSDLKMNTDLERNRKSKRRLNINNHANDLGSLGVPQRMVSTIITPSLVYDNSADKNNDSIEGKNNKDEGNNAIINNTTVSSSNSGRKQTKKKGIVSLLNGDVSMD
ncbi:hypothetical protein ACO0SA_000428 [Hanseniaspora valbyensis]